MKTAEAQWTGLVIRQTRRRKGMTQADLAMAVSDQLGPEHDINQSTVSRWENGGVGVSLRCRLALASVLGIDQSILLGAPPDGAGGARARERWAARPASAASADSASTSC